MLLTAIVAVCLAPVVWWKGGEWVTAVVLVTGGILLLHQRYVLAAACCLVGALMLLPSIDASPSSDRAVCVNNLKGIALAILAYESEHGHLPPPYTTDAMGNRLHSCAF